MWHRSGTGGLLVGNVLWIIIGVLVLLWIGGLVMQIGGKLIWALLVLAVIVFVIQVITGRRAV